MDVFNVRLALGCRPFSLFLHTMRRVLYTLMVCMLSCMTAMGDRLHFSNISTEAGLSNKMVTSIVQDAEGYIWFATSEGLNRYDGTRFKVFLSKPGEESTLRSSWVNDIHLLMDGRLMVATERGVSIYDSETRTFVPLAPSNDSQNLLATVRIKCIFEDEDSIWFGTAEGVIGYSKANNFINFVKLAPASLDSRANEVKSIFRDKAGGLWIATFDGLYLFNDKDFTHERFEFALGDRPANNYISSLCQMPDDSTHLFIGTSQGLVVMNLEDRSYVHFKSGPSGLCNNDIKFVRAYDSSRLMIGTNNGLSMFTPSDGRFETYSGSLVDKTSIAGQTVWCAFEDDHSIVWIGTNNGVSKIDKNRKSLDLFKVVTSENGEVRNVMVSDIVFLPDGRRWLGTKDGIMAYDHDMRYVKTYNVSNSGLLHNQIKRLLVSSNGLVWVGTNDGIAYYDSGSDRFSPVPPDRKDISLKYVYDMKEDQDGDIVVNISNGLCIFTPVYSSDMKRVVSYSCKDVRIDKMSMSANTDVTYIDTDKSHRIWFGTINEGLFSYDKRTGNISQYRFEAGNESSINSNRIYTLHVDQRGAVWVGTDMGLCRLDPSSGKFLRFEGDMDLSKAIRTITSDSKGRLWLCLLNKIVMFDFEHNNKIVCDVLQDLDCNELEYNSFYKDNDRVYFGGNGSLIKVDPLSVKINIQKAPMKITDVDLEKNGFSADFALLDYSSPLNNKYLYQLEGHDREWLQTDAKRSGVTYSNLTPGRYTFKVRGCNPDGIFSEEASYSFLIKPPLLLRWWAVLAYLCVAGGLIAIGVWQYTTHRTLSRQLDEEKEERNRIESLNKVKMNFFTNISHEFKTPLSLILGPLESLMDQAEDKKQLAQMKLMKHNGERMLRLINQILDLREIDNDKISLNLSSGNIVALARNVFESFLENSERRGMVYEFVSEEEINCSFDKDKMENILYNLLSNAFKFTPDNGSIQLCLSQTDSQKGPQVNITVVDSGQGMDEEERKHIFDRFYQGKAKSFEKISSTGIGLGLTKDFVELHGGTISVESVLGQGSTFSVTIPANIKENTVQSQVVDESDLSHRRLVVIDDNADILTFIKLNLGNSFIIQTSTSPEKGLEIVKETCPDVVVLDVMMPEMDGLELCRRIRSDEVTSHIPVIFLTAKSNEDDMAKGYEAGADGYITKPFSIRVLKAKIETLVKSRESLKEFYKEKIQTPSQTVTAGREDDKFMATLIKKIEENLDNSEYTVQNLCDDTAYSYLQIYRKVKAVTGITINEFIRNLRLSKAAYMLEHSDMRVSEIMYSVGFSTHSYFTKCFKDCYGVTPREYAAGHRSEAEE